MVCVEISDELNRKATTTTMITMVITLELLWHTAVRVAMEAMALLLAGRGVLESLKSLRALLGIHGYLLSLTLQAFSIGSDKKMAALLSHRSCMHPAITSISCAVVRHLPRDPKATAKNTNKSIEQNMDFFILPSTEMSCSSVVMYCTIDPVKLADRSFFALIIKVPHSTPSYLNTNWSPT